MEFQTAPVVPTIPDAMDCCDSETLVAAKRLATRYERSAPMTPMTICVSAWDWDGEVLIAGKDMAQYVRPRGCRAPRSAAMA